MAVDKPTPERHALVTDRPAGTPAWEGPRLGPGEPTPGQYGRPTAVSGWSAEARLRHVWPKWPRLVRLAISRGAGPHDSEDLASESILRAAESECLDCAQDAWPYLARTLVNLMTDHYRRDVRESRAQHRASEMPRQRCLEEDVVNRATAAHELRRLSALESLETVRLVIDYVGDDLTWEELSYRHGISATAGRKRVTRALHRLHDRSVRGTD